MTKHSMLSLAIRTRISLRPVETIIYFGRRFFFFFFFFVDLSSSIARFWNADRMLPFHFYGTSDGSATSSPSIRSLAFSADGERIAVGYEDGLIEIYPTPSVFARCSEC